MARNFLAGVLVVSALLSGCATTGMLTGSRPPQGDVGLASYYARKFHQRRTASGEVYDQDGMTAAHRRLPFGTRVRVTNLHNGKSVILRINDRGPFRKERIIDVSYRAARQLGFVGRGVAEVRVEVVEG